jgi:hypothetical protein
VLFLTLEALMGRLMRARHENRLDREEPTRAGQTGGTASNRARRDLASSCESRYSVGPQPTISQRPYLLPWVRLLLLILDLRSTTWGHARWPHVKPRLRRALEMRRQIARDGWWN